MVKLYWPQATTFLARDQQYTGPGVHDVPDELEEKFRARGWEDPSEDDESEDEPMEYERRVALAEGTANADYQDAVEEVESGEADAYLDELEKVDDRTTVQDAIANRRDDLEG